MTLANHVAGGIVFTGVFGGIAGINILESPGLIVATLVAATIPDVDLPHSLWGRVFGPVSKMINRRFGHRTITHSLLFMAGLGISTKVVCSMLKVEAPYPTVVLLAFFSHLLFDMMTVQGVPILYPYKKNPCVIPADPNMRFNSNNRRTELAIFGFFIASGLFMQPLMSDGFWTTYNRMFGTIQHLQSEFEKSEDLLIATYKYREASNEFQGAGYVIEAAGDYAILWDEREGWEYLDGSPKSTRTILEVIPEHTGKRFEIRRENFVGISRDSLESIISESIVYEVEMTANKPFGATYGARNGPEQMVGASLTLQMVDYLNVNEIGAIQSSKKKPLTKKVRYQQSPRIRTLEAKIRKLERKAQSETREYKKHFTRLAEIEREMDKELDIYEITRLQKEFRELEAKKMEIPDYSSEEEELRVQIAEIKQKDQDTYSEKKEAAEAAFANASSVDVSSGPLRLTGILTTIDFRSGNENRQSK